MGDDLYNVVFRGDISPGEQMPAVRQKFAQLFKLEPDRVDLYFTGKPVPLKKNCDLSTAQKFHGALLQIGACSDIVDAVSGERYRPPVVAVPASAAPLREGADAGNAGTAAESAGRTEYTGGAEDAAGNWSLAAPGADLLRAADRHEPEPVRVNVEHLKVVRPKAFSTEPEEPLEPPRPPVAAPVISPALSLEPQGSDLLKPEERENFWPRQIDLSALRLDAVGTDLLHDDEKPVVVPVAVTVPDVGIAAAGADLGQIVAPPPPPPPATEHLSVQKN